MRSTVVPLPDIMRCAFALALCSSAAAGPINLLLTDCGDSDTKTHVTALNTTSIEQGTPTPIAGTGTLDVAVTDGTFTSTVRSLGVVLTNCTGPVCGEST